MRRVHQAASTIDSMILSNWNDLFVGKVVSGTFGCTESGGLTVAKAEVAKAKEIKLELTFILKFECVLFANESKIINEVNRVLLLSFDKHRHLIFI